MTAKPYKILMTVLCLLALLALPFLVTSPTLQSRESESVESDPLDDLFSLLLPHASAEEAAALPVDFTPGNTPNPDAYTADGYEDESITVRMETRDEGTVTYRIAFVTIKHPSQLRTATAGSLSSSRVAMPSSMARKNNAIVAINGDYFSNDPSKTTFEYRQGEKIRAKSNRKKDILIIDENADFHLFVKSDADKLAEFAKSEHTVINAFTFGPALVIDGELQQIDASYGYNPNGREPRMGIGQTGPLSYVLVLAEGRTSDSEGATQQEFADYLYSLGCVQAFNLDGGNSATMIFNGDYYQVKSAGSERAQSDIIYFATAVDPAAWQ